MLMVPHPTSFRHFSLLLYFLPCFFKPIRVKKSHNICFVLESISLFFYANCSALEFFNFIKSNWFILNIVSNCSCQFQIFLFSYCWIISSVTFFFYVVLTFCHFPLFSVWFFLYCIVPWLWFSCREDHGHHEHESYYGDRDTDSLVKVQALQVSVGLFCTKLVVW